MTVNSISKDKESLTNNIAQELDNELRITPIPFTMLYTPQTDDYRLSEVGFIIIDDGWSENSLLDLKHKTGLGTLFALQTTDKRINKFEVIEGIIVCESDEVEQVITVFESVLSVQDKVGIDVNDIKRSCGAEKPAKFIQTTVMGTADSEHVERGVNHLLNQIPEGLSIEYMMLDIESAHKLSLDEFFSVAIAVENRIVDDAEVFYGDRTIDRSNHCWMGAIYVADFT